MSVHTGIQAAHRTDSHGHCPQNRLTCANQQAELCAPRASARANVRRGKADEPPTGGYHPIPTRPRHYPPTPDTRTPQADGAWGCRPSQHDSDLPTEPVTLIDLPCTSEVPGIHLPWTCATTGRAPATTPTHPMPNRGRYVSVYLCADLYIANGGGDRHPCRSHRACRIGAADSSSVGGQRWRTDKSFGCVPGNAPQILNHLTALCCGPPLRQL
jgi:hypothetical protein